MNQRGFSLMEVLMGLGIMAFLATLSASVFSLYAQQSKMAATGSTIIEVRDELAKMIRDDLSWDRTVSSANGPGQPFACFAGTGNCGAFDGTRVQFQPLKADGTLHRSVNSMVANEGYNSLGNRCTTFNAGAPNPNCLIKFTFYRTIRCPTGANTGGGCIKPPVDVDIVFEWAALDNWQTLRRQKIVNLAFKNITQTFTIPGTARTVQPFTCPAGSVVTQIRRNGSLVCTNWNSL